MSAGAKARRAKPRPKAPTIRYEICETTGKRAFPDRLTALAGFTAAQRHIAVKRIYRCGFCGLWHLTSKKRRS